MRVALISFDFGEYCMQLSNALSEHAEVMLILPTREAAPLQGRLLPRVRLQVFHRARLRQPVGQARMCAEIVRHVRRWKPDVVHLQQGHLWLNFALPLLGSRPLVVTIHDHRPHPGDRGAMKTPQRVMDLAFHRADQAIVHAEQLRREVIDQRGLRPDAVHVIPHVAIGELGSGPGLAKATGENGQRVPTVLFFGRIWPYKGLEYLIRAEPFISAHIPDVRFVIAGEGEDLQRYRAMMAHPDRFEIHNTFVSAERRAELFAGATVVALPYVEASQSGVVPVAYAFGKPVIATRVGGLPEVVEDRCTGLLVPPADERALADAIVMLLRAPAFCRELGQRGRERLQRECSPAHVAGRTLQVYGLAQACRSRTARGGMNTIEDSATSLHDSENELRDSADALHRYLLSRHWRGDALVGPDSGVRFNYRIGRFVKSYLRHLPWRDDLYYLQSQAYWILASWHLFDVTHADGHRERAERCAAEVVRRQRPDGAWDYPNPEWSGRVATVEGAWAAIGLLETARRGGDRRYLDSALRWHEFFERRIGWQRVGDGLAVNYFAGATGDPVPNNSALALRYLGELASVSGDERFLDRCLPMISFLSDAQRESGELPYALGGEGTRLEHFQCAQYNAFQCIDLLRCRQLLDEPAVTPLIEGVLRFLVAEVRSDGTIPYHCGSTRPLVTYHLAAVACALNEGARAGLGPSEAAAAASRARRRLLTLQRPSGNYPHSLGDYGFLSDQRAYPRNQAMILLHSLAMLTPEAAVTAPTAARAAEVRA